MAESTLLFTGGRSTSLSDLKSLDAMVDEGGRLGERECFCRLALVEEEGEEDAAAAAAVVVVEEDLWALEMFLPLSTPSSTISESYTGFKFRVDLGTRSPPPPRMLGLGGRLLTGGAVLLAVVVVGFFSFADG